MRGFLFHILSGFFITLLLNLPQKSSGQNSIAIPLTVKRQIDSLNRLLAQSVSDSDRIRLYAKLAWTYLGVPELQKARYYADSVKQYASAIKDSHGVMKALYYYGIADRLAGNYEEALTYLNQYLRFYEQKGDSSRVAGGLYQVATVNTSLGNFEQSLAAYYRVLEIEEQDKNYYSVGYTLNTIGIILFETNKYADAEKMYNRALIIFDTLNELRDKTDVLVNQGNLYTEMGLYSKAMNKYSQALLIDRSSGKETGVALTLANIGFLYDKMLNYDSALYYHLRALQLRQNLPNKEHLARSLIGAGMGYIHLKKFDSAEHYLLVALPVVKETASKRMLRDLYENLSNLYSLKGNYAKAFQYQKLYIDVKDSLLNELSSKQLNELQTKYETGEKDKQILLLEKEKQIQQKEAERQAALKKGFLAGGLLLVLVAVLLSILFWQRMKNQRLLANKNQELTIANYRRLSVELEMKALRAQINPHFLFNCMNSLNRMILSGETENASFYLSKFSKLVRTILENAESETVSLESELAMLEAYIQLEELRFKGKIDYRISIDESINPESTYLPSMLLQPFVENAIWHGLLHKEENEKGQIIIAVKEAGNHLTCTIEDNGVGREKAKLLSQNSILKTKSLGLAITHERLKLLNHETSENSIRITDLKTNSDHPRGTRVEINIPFTET